MPCDPLPDNVLYAFRRSGVNQRIPHKLDRVFGGDELVLLPRAVHIVFIVTVPVWEILPAAKFARWWGDV